MRRRFVVQCIRLTIMLGVAISLWVIGFSHGSDQPIPMPVTQAARPVAIVKSDQESLVKQEAPLPVEETESLVDEGPVFYYPTRPTSKPNPNIIPIVIVACNRPGVARSLESIFRYKPKDRFPVFVSQDCEHANTTSAIQRFRGKVFHMLQPERDDPETLPQHKEYVRYYWIARHYKWIMEQVLEIMQYEQLIILEDDMEIAPDFFDYFESFLPVLKQDSSLFCVSAWNDNGKIGMVEDPKIMFKTDFFPGLGWMTTRKFWLELKPKWPATFWDDWLRHPNQHQGRGCIRPEVSRTFNFGREGVSGGLYYDEHIGKIQLSQKRVNYVGLTEDRTTLISVETLPTRKKEFELHAVDVRMFLKQYYEASFRRQVYEFSTQVSTRELIDLIENRSPSDVEIYRKNANWVVTATETSSPTVYDDVNNIHYCGDLCRRRFRIVYHTQNYRGGAWALTEQVQLLDQWKLMSDIREDIARVSYLGVVAFKVKLKHPQPLNPPRYRGASDDREEYYMVYIAPAI